MTMAHPGLDAVVGNEAIDERAERLAEGADRLARGRRPLAAHPQFLLTVSATLMLLGLTAIVIGWVGAAHSTFVEEQVPYLISGGLLGLALTTVGALSFFSHWLTVWIRESRHQDATRRQEHAELLQALRALGRQPAEPAPQENVDGRARSTRAERPVRRAPRRT